MDENTDNDSIENWKTNPGHSESETVKIQFELAMWRKDLYSPFSRVDVYLHWPPEYDAPLGHLMFEDPETLGRFIKSLIQLRRLVWPKSDIIFPG